jgi:hypothetical protein
MSVFKILGGIVIGVGAVALVPFTGGGSLLGAATLVGSLTGAGALAAGVGVAGGVIGGAVGEIEKRNEKERNKNAFTEGAKAAEIEMKKKFNSIISDVVSRDKFIVLATTIGIAIAKCDNDLSNKELNEINKYSGNIFGNPFIMNEVKKRVKQIIEVGANFEDVKKETKLFLEGRTKKSKIECLSFLDDMVNHIIQADNIIHSNEKAFKVKWLEFVKQYR